MPLYEYECGKCGAHYEKLQKFSDPPLATCEECGGKLKRLLSPSTIQFKGSGWYVTDYARKSSPPEATKPESSSSAGGEGSVPGKTEGSGAGEGKKVAEPSTARRSRDSKSPSTD